MPLDPTAVLAGPRGRRLCLELVTAWSPDGAAGSDAVRRAVLEAAYDLDPGRGTSRVRFTLGDPPTEPAPAVTPDDVARLLAAAPLPAVDEPSVLRAFATAVAMARSWQEPDGEDVLAATERVRAALARAAAHLVRAPAAAWWTAPLDTDGQWAVRFEGRPERHEVRLPAAETLARWRTAAVAEEDRAARERPRDPTAAWSGTWWSTPPRGLRVTTRARGVLGPVGLWLEEDGYGEADATARPVTVRPGARVLEIDGPDAWADLCRRHPLDVTASRRHDWFRTTGRDGRWVVPDWSRVAADADAVHLTVAGYLTTAGRAVPVDGDVASVLAGWNPDETFWLMDPPGPGLPEQVWHRDRDAWQRLD